MPNKPYKTGEHAIIDLIGLDSEPDPDTVLLALRSIATASKTKILNYI